MPTTKQRYAVTDTDGVERALDIAQQRWPDEPRSRLLVKVIEAGGEALLRSPIEERLRKRLIVEELRREVGKLFRGVTKDDLDADEPA